MQKCLPKKLERDGRREDPADDSEGRLCGEGDRGTVQAEEVPDDETAIRSGQGQLSAARSVN